LVVVGILQLFTFDNTDETLRDQQRARIIPVGASLLFPPVDKRGIAFNVSVINTGHEPAPRINIAIANGERPAIQAQDTDLAGLEVPENTSCDGLNPSPGRPPIPPTGSDRASSFAVSESSEFGTPPRLADSSILDGTKFYVANGCIVYLDRKERRYSSFCYMMVSIPIEMQTNGANAKIANGRRFFFVTCRGGFDSN
jgi:hypothetical protein